MLESYEGEFDDQVCEYFTRGAICAAENAFEKSVQHFEKALFHISHHFGLSAFEIWSAKSVAHQLNKEYDQAFVAAVRAAECQQEIRDQQLMLMFRTCRSKKHRLAALSMAHVLVVRNPNDINAREARLAAILDLGQYQELAFQANKVLGADPTNAFANDIKRKLESALGKDEIERIIQQREAAVPGDEKKVSDTNGT